MNLIIDTNIFRKNPKRDNTEWNAITFLAIQEKIQIFMPYIIQEEFLSQEETNREKQINMINKAMKSLQRSIKDKEILNICKSEFHQLSKEIVSNVRDEFSEWLDNLKIKELPLTLSQSKKSWSSYFSGNPPFPIKKKRNDLPDSIIFEAICENFSEENSLIFISEDGNLKLELDKLEYVTIFNSLNDFIKDDIFQTLLTEPPHIFIQKREEDLSKYLEENEYLIEDLFLDKIKKYSNEIETNILHINEFDDTEFSSFNMDYMELPLALNKINITSINYYGDSKIKFNIVFEITEANVSFFMDKYLALNTKFREDDPNYDLYQDEVYDSFYINDSSSYGYYAEVIQEFSSIVFKANITLQFNFKEKELDEFIDDENFDLEVSDFFDEESPFILESIENIEIESYCF